MIDKPILAIDYGMRRVGLAISDHKGLFASPLPIIQITRKKTVNDLIEEIIIIAEQYRVKSILLGMPQAFEKQHNLIQEEIKYFADKLVAKSGLRVTFYDESYSTKGAENMLLSLGQSRRKNSGKIDSIAAATFLSEYLDAELRNKTKQHPEGTNQE